MKKLADILYFLGLVAFCAVVLLASGSMKLAAAVAIAFVYIELCIGKEHP